MTSVSELIVIFLQLTLFANTAAFTCALQGLVSHFFQKATAVWKLAGNGIGRKDQSLTRFVACVQKRWPTIQLFMSIGLSKIFPFMPIATSWKIS